MTSHKQVSPPSLHTGDEVSHSPGGNCFCLKDGHRGEWQKMFDLLKVSHTPRDAVLRGLSWSFGLLLKGRGQAMSWVLAGWYTASMISFQGAFYVLVYLFKKVANSAALYYNSKFGKATPPFFLGMQRSARLSRGLSYCHTKFKGVLRQVCSSVGVMLNGAVRRRKKYFGNIMILIIWILSNPDSCFSFQVHNVSLIEVSIDSRFSLEKSAKFLRILTPRYFQWFWTHV